MAKISTNRGSQSVQAAVFEFGILDTTVDVDGVTKTFKNTAVVAPAFFLPVNSVVLGGDVVVTEVSNDTGTATVSLGDSGSATRHASAVNMKALARTALTLTGYTNSGGLDLRVTLANNTGDATTGRVRITILYMTIGRVTEVQTH